jgi:general secretion pathway protein I
MCRKTFDHGFTLIEVLVALAILAVALGASVRAASIATDGAIEVKERILATWVAQNRIAEYSVGAVPAVGSNRQTVEQGGMKFNFQETVAPTTLFRDYVRIEIRVFTERRPEYAIAKIVTYANKTTP